MPVQIRRLTFINFPSLFSYQFTNMFQYVLGTEPDVDRFHPIALPRISDDIIRFDEHTVSTWHKFGVLYQTFGQVIISPSFLFILNFSHASSRISAHLTHVGMLNDLSSLPRRCQLWNWLVLILMKLVIKKSNYGTVSDVSRPCLFLP